MAPVFSRDAWRCVWHMIQVTLTLLSIGSFISSYNVSFLHLIVYEPKQNDLVHGWGLDFALRRCVEVHKSSLCCCLVFVQMFLHVWSINEEAFIFICENEGACIWEDRNSRLTVDRSSIYPFPWQPGYLTSSLSPFQNQLKFLILSPFLANRGKQITGKHHGKG